MISTILKPLVCSAASEERQALSGEGQIGALKLFFVSELLSKGNSLLTEEVTRGD